MLARADGRYNPAERSNFKKSLDSCSDSGICAAKAGVSEPNKPSLSESG